MCIRFICAQALELRVTDDHVDAFDGNGSRLATFVNEVCLQVEGRSSRLVGVAGRRLGEEMSWKPRNSPDDLLELDEISLQCDPGVPRDRARFLESCGSRLGPEPDWDHEHFSDFLRMDDPDALHRVRSAPSERVIGLRTRMTPPARSAGVPGA